MDVIDLVFFAIWGPLAGLTILRGLLPGRRPAPAVGIENLESLGDLPSRLKAQRAFAAVDAAARAPREGTLALVERTGPPDGALSPATANDGALSKPAPDRRPSGAFEDTGDAPR